MEHLILNSNTSKCKAISDKARLFFEIYRWPLPDSDTRKEGTSCSAMMGDYSTSELQADGHQNTSLPVMWYIRFQNLPRVIGDNLETNIIVENDLGDLRYGKDLQIEVRLYYAPRVDDPDANWTTLWSDQNANKGTLKIKMPIPKSYVGIRGMLVIEPDPKHRKAFQAPVCTFDDILEKRVADPDHTMDGIVPVYCSNIPINLTEDDTYDDTPRAYRRFDSLLHNRSIAIFETVEESIARHVWDGGLFLSAFLLSYLSHGARPPIKTLPERLPGMIKMLTRGTANILELGAGTGIVGITLRAFFPTLNVTLTDLPDAVLLPYNAAHPSNRPNIWRNKDPANTSLLDWTKPVDPELANTPWDLIIFADCIYNSDVVPDLLKTIAALRKHPEVHVLMATKHRHGSEASFFPQMSNYGWIIADQADLLLGARNGEREHMQVCLFKMPEGWVDAPSIFRNNTRGEEESGERPGKKVR